MPRSSAPGARRALTAPKPAVDWRLIGLVAYLCTLVLEGPVRMLLTLIGLETLLYARDMVALATVAWVAFRGYPDGSRLNVAALVFYLMVCHAVISWWLGHPVFSVLFGFKIFLSFMFGVACADLLRQHERWVLRLASAFLVVTALGVFLNVVVGTFPWEGGAFESAFGVSRNSNIWWSGGERRLAGFARMSFSAAVIIGICAVFVISQIAQLHWKLLAVALALPAIYLTTSKGVILAFVFAAGLGFLPPGPWRLRLGLGLLWFFALVAALLPFGMLYAELNPNLMRLVPSVLSSFVDRAAVTWPGAIADLSEWYHLVLGQGVGGIGGALKYGNEHHRYNPIDNLFLYLYCTFGAMGLVYYVLSLVQVTRLARDERMGPALLAVGVLIFGYGVTAHQTEDAFVGIVFGLMVGAMPWAAVSWRSVRVPT